MKTNRTLTIDIGIPENDRRKIAEGLSRLLADTFTLYLKSDNFHWNVTGPWFYELHQKFEDIYKELAMDVDNIAERIRALGYAVPASFADYLRLGSIKEEEGSLDGVQMVESLVQGHEVLVKAGRKIVEGAEDGGDVATANLVTDFIQAKEKTTWMLRSFLTPTASAPSES